MNPDISLYQRLGGEVAVRRLVDRFYDLMSTLPEAAGIRAMHPELLQSSRDKLFMFLSGWLGGPQLYIERFGHPKLRARHLPFTIGEAERDAWMLCMRRALAEQQIDDPLLLGHLQQSLYNLANHMRNQ
ncbi:MAG: group II truncated hemoglobin [Gammaproteobacteria bacterium]|nr:group II truncated hemoglobin [Gammaproteobacteria bacterium]